MNGVLYKGILWSTRVDGPENYKDNQIYAFLLFTCAQTDESLFGFGSY